MGEPDLTDSAIAELYSGEPEQFTERRQALAARARAAGDTAAARAIAALRRPTRAAWLVNSLARADPSVAPRIAELGELLRAGEAALDGPGLRALSQQRRKLVQELTGQALALAGPEPGPAALREEIAATFGAALADPEVAGQVAAGTLVRAARFAGFGPGIGSAAPAGPRAGAIAGAGGAAEADAGQRDRERRERERRAAIESARLAVATATERAARAAAEAKEHDALVQVMERQLADAHERAARKRADSERAAEALATARQALASLAEGGDRPVP